VTINPEQIGRYGIVVFHKENESDEGKYYVIPEETWKQSTNVVDKAEVGRAAVLVERGAVFADIPDSPDPVGAYCLLINLASLKPPRKP
jgi:hypothetical protein